MSTRAQTVEKALQAATTVFLFLYVFVEPASIAVTHIFYAAAAVTWLVRVAIVRGRGLRSGPLDLPILVYLVICAIATLEAPYAASAWEGMRKVALVCVVLVFAQNVRSLDRARHLVAVLLFSGLVTVGWSLWLYLGGVGLHVGNVAPQSPWHGAGLRSGDVILKVDGRSINSPQRFREYLRIKPADAPLQLSVVSVNEIEVTKNARPVTVAAGDWQAVDTLLDLPLAKARPARAFGFYSHYVTYSMVLALIAALTFGLWLGTEDVRSGRSLMLAAAFLAFSVALAMTLTRAAWAALLFACAVQLWFHSRRTIVRALLPVALVIAVLAGSAAMYRWRGVTFLDPSDPGTDYRLLMWKDGWRLIRAHPWFGVGMNAVRDFWGQFNLAAYRKYPLRSHFHSTPIQIAVETGIPSLVAWIIFMAVYWGMLVVLVGRARRAPDRWAYGYALGALGATSGLLMSSIVHYDFGDSVVIFLFWFLAGIALAVWQQLAPREIP